MSIAEGATAVRRPSTTARRTNSADMCDPSARGGSRRRIIARCRPGHNPHGGSRHRAGSRTLASRKRARALGLRAADHRAHHLPRHHLRGAGVNRLRAVSIASRCSFPRQPPSRGIQNGEPTTKARARTAGRIAISSQCVEANMREVATATRHDGRPDRRASMTMPGPARRATFGTSAVMPTLLPDSRVWIMRRSAWAPPLRWMSLGLPPAPRMGAGAERLEGGRDDVASRRGATHHAELVARRLHERRHEGIAVPHRDDEGEDVANFGIEVFGLGLERTRPVDGLEPHRDAGAGKAPSARASQSCSRFGSGITETRGGPRPDAK